MQQKELCEKMQENIYEAANVINKGGLVLFPTETVYGIGASGLNELAVKKIYQAKGRNSDNPLILHISNMDMLDMVAKDITDEEYILMKTFWPGPFTIILNKKDIVPDIVTGGLNTVAIRMPSNNIANKLIQIANVPIAAPSANISGKPSGTSIADIYEELKDKIDYVIDGGKCEVGLESTVIRVQQGSVRILRPGKITKEQIEKVMDSVILDENIMGNVKDNETVMSPGMKYKHYAPNAFCTLVYSDNNLKMIEKINDIASKYDNVSVICCKENSKQYNATNVIQYGSKNSLEEISSNIFSVLRKVDKYKSDIVLIEGVTTKGIGLAIMNRLIRACSHRYIVV
jgi:L-threonylcarbamoyladenylate synthase